MIDRRITVLLIEDNRLLREGLAAVVNEQADFKLLAAADGGAAAVQQAERAQPQVVLLSARLWSHDSVGLLKALTRASPRSKVIVTDLSPGDEDVIEFAKEGVAGFILEDASFEDIAGTIRSAAHGEPVVPPVLLGTLLSQIAEQRGKGRQAALVNGVLTNRQRQVANLIAESLSNKEIAERLHLSVYTVKSHVRNIMAKLVLRKRLQIADYARTPRAR